MTAAVSKPNNPHINHDYKNGSENETITLNMVWVAANVFYVSTSVMFGWLCAITGCTKTWKKLN